MIVDTGRSTCFGDSQAITCPDEGEAFYGQDAQYTGAQPRYFDNGDGTFFEVTPDGEIVWLCANPFTGQTSSGKSNSVFRCYRYAADYVGVAGKV